MSGASENENEIVLGNKQLAGIFLMVAILLGVAFTAGYMVGHGGSAAKKNPLAAADTNTSPDGEKAPEAVAKNKTSEATGGQTHTVGAEGAANLPASDEGSAAPARPQEPPLGTRKSKETATIPSVDHEQAGPPDNYTPRPGTRYLQVAAVSRDEAEAVADVLHRKGFHAHAVPKPGSAKLYRVIIGPVRDAGDLSSTRDALRKTGFREVIVQNY